MSLLLPHDTSVKPKLLRRLWKTKTGIKFGQLCVDQNTCPHLTSRQHLSERPSVLSDKQKEQATLSKYQVNVYFFNTCKRNHNDDHWHKTFSIVKCFDSENM